MTYVPEQAGLGGGGGGGGTRVGALLWEWNGLDVTQFDAAALSLQGGDGAATMVLSAFNGAPFDGKLGLALRCAYVATTGGGIFLVKASELVLPARYVISLRHYGTRGTHLLNIFAGAVIFSDALAAPNAMIIERKSTVSNLTSTSFSAGAVDDQATMSSSGTYNDPATTDRRGVHQLITVERQTGTTPSDFRFNVEERRGDGGISYDGNERVVDHSNLTTPWDGLDLARFGLGGWVNVAGRTGSLDIAEFKVFAHPEA